MTKCWVQHLRHCSLLEPWGYCGAKLSCNLTIIPFCHWSLATSANTSRLKIHTSSTRLSEINILICPSQCATGHVIKHNSVDKCWDRERCRRRCCLVALRSQTSILCSESLALLDWNWILHYWPSPFASNFSETHTHKLCVAREHKPEWAKINCGCHEKSSPFCECIRLGRGVATVALKQRTS